MGLILKTTNTISLLFLCHAVYSAYEHTLLTSSSASPSSVTDALPLDITVEALVSLFVLVAGVVLGSSPLRPIQWREWAAMVDKEDHLPAAERARLLERKLKGYDGGGLVGSPYLELERRSGFVDIRAQRREYAEWVKNGEKAA